MDMTIITYIKSLVAEHCPDYSFEYESNRMMNVRSDDTPFPCVFFEEYTEGKVVKEKYGWKEQTLVELSFMKLANFQADAIEREAIREDIRNNAVLPILNALQHSNVIDPITEFNLLPEPPRFDANCVSLLLRFYVTRPLCF